MCHHGDRGKHWQDDTQDQTNERQEKITKSKPVDDDPTVDPGAAKVQTSSTMDDGEPMARPNSETGPSFNEEKGDEAGAAVGKSEAGEEEDDSQT